VSDQSRAGQRWGKDTHAPAFRIEDGQQQRHLIPKDGLQLLRLQGGVTVCNGDPCGRGDVVSRPYCEMAAHGTNEGEGDIVDRLAARICVAVIATDDLLQLAQSERPAETELRACAAPDGDLRAQPNSAFLCCALHVLFSLDATHRGVQQSPCSSHCASKVCRRSRQRRVCLQSLCQTINLTPLSLLATHTHTHTHTHARELTHEHGERDPPRHRQDSGGSSVADMSPGRTERPKMPRSGALLRRSSNAVFAASPAAVGWSAPAGSVACAATGGAACRLHLCVACRAARRG